MELRVITVSFKVAVASSDGKFVNQHFGMTQQFLIFEIKKTNYPFLNQVLSRNAYLVLY